MVIDVTRLADRMLRGRLPTGVDRVSLEYIRHFRSGARALVRVAGRWVVLNPSDSQRAFNALLARDRGSSREVRWCVGRNYALGWRNTSGPSVLLNTGHSGLDHPGYARQVRRHGWKPFFFLHDLIPITHPEYCRSGEADKHYRRLETMVKTGQGLIVNSSTTRDALESFADRYAWTVPPCVIAPLAPTRLPTPVGSRPLAEPYFVVLGTIEPRKNHLQLLQLWRQIVEELAQAAPRLVIIGQRGWECEQVVDMLERCAVLQQFVLEQPCCTDAELATWLHHAQALLFPSFAEGYGIPLVEALAQGVPVIASNLPVFHETAEDIPDYLDPLDGAGWKHRILDYAKPDSAARSAQVWRMKQVRLPTWEEHFALVEDFLRDIYGSH